MATAVTKMRIASSRRPERQDLGMNFDHIISSFIASRRRGTGTARVEARPATIENYTNDLRYFFDFLRERFKYSYWNEVNRADVLEFVDWARQETGWSRSTVSKRLRTLRAMFLWMDDDEDCQDMHMRGFRKQLGIINKSDSRLHVPTKDDIKKFVEVCNLNTRAGLRNYTVVMTLAGTGMRSGELRLLTLDHLKLEDRMVIVPEGGKTGTRIVAVREDLITDLRRWLRKREQFARCDKVFVTNRGHQLETFALPHTFRALRKQSGIEGITPHTLRHFFVTNWLREGQDMFKLKAMTGHKNMQTLEGYAHLLGDPSVNHALDRVDPLRGIRPDRRTGKSRTPIKPNKEERS